MYCPKCGKENTTGKFCGYCGAPLDGAVMASRQEKPKVQPKTKWFVIGVPVIVLALIVICVVFNSPSHRIIGTWYYAGEEDVDGWITFSKDGICSMSDEEGTCQYRIEGNDTLILMIDDWSSDFYEEEYTFEFKDGGLNLYQDGDMAGHFEKAHR